MFCVLCVVLIASKKAHKQKHRVENQFLISPGPSGHDGGMVAVAAAAAVDYQIQVRTSCLMIKISSLKFLLTIDPVLLLLYRYYLIICRS